MYDLGTKGFVLFLIAVVALCGGNDTSAADKSGVSPNTISLPKGPGSIEGLGESFQPTLNTGTAKYGIALKLPPGTGGQAPSLSLSYEGGGGNGVVGFGWNLSMPNVQRRTDKGVPLYEGEPPPTIGDDWSARYRSFINDMKEELVPQADGYWFSKNEGAFVRYQLTNGYWVGTAPEGTRLEYGLTSDGRVQDGNDRVFSWMLERESDTRGNVIQYFYTGFPGASNLNQKYLTEIRYGPGAPPWNNFHFARFEYEDRPDWFEDCRAGFVVRTGKRLKRIVIGTQGPSLAQHQAGDFNADGIGDNLVRRYDLSYLEYAGTNSYWSLLAAVQPVGADGVSALPPSTFGYNICNPPDNLSAASRIVLSHGEPSQVMDNSNVELVELNGDGLPDILRTFPGGSPAQAHINLGESESAGTRYLRWTNAVTMTGDVRAAGYSLSQGSVHLADMDGDGIADLVSQPDAATIIFFRNPANLSWANRRTMITQDVVPPSPFGNVDVRTADVDFDKNIDIIQSAGDRYYVWLNLGTNRYSSRKSQTNGTVFSFALTNVHIADFNGDRLPDIARVGQASVVVTAGLGYGRFAAPVTVTNLFSDGEVLTADQAQRARLQDITGDGMADLVIERATGNQLWYWINLGNYRFGNRKIISGLPGGGITVVRWADLNGDGSTDLVYAGTTPTITNKLQMVDLGRLLNCGTSPNVLTAISNGIGRVTLIGYAPSTKFAAEDAAAGRAWTNIMPNPVTVVACVTNLDSLGHSYLTKFRYHDGYYDAAEKQFRGFARVEQVDVGDVTAPTLVTRSHFDTGRDFEAMKGRLIQLTSETEDGRVFTDDITSWTIPPRVLMTGTNGTNVSYAHPLGHVKTVKELGQGTERILETELAFDQFGNQTTNIDYGIVEGGDRTAWNDERITVTEYAINTNLWIVRHPKRQELRDRSGGVISRSDSFYDDETFSGNNFGIVTIGNLTLKREWISPSNSTATIAAARTKYDSYGNPTIIIDPLATATGGTFSPGVGHGRTLEFDPRFHAYPVREIIHVGGASAPLIFEAEYDEGFGTVTRSTDFNTNVTSYGYDTFARLINIVKPYDTAAYPTAEYDYVLAVPAPGGGVVNFVETRQLDRTPGSAGAKRNHYLISRQFVDGLGRKLLSKQEAEPAPGSSEPRVVVTEATLFNTRQKPSRVLNPHFTTMAGGDLDSKLSYESIEAPGWSGQFQENGSLVDLPLATAHQSLSDYDASLRDIRHTNPDGTQSRTVYEPLLTRSYDENDNDPASQYHDTPMAHYNDGLGRLVRVDEVTRLNDDGTPAGSLRAWTTRYEYDLNDQLTRITDSQDNVKLMRYDGLKRKTFMNDPDRGHMTYIYDDASNLRETIDAKSQHITYTYDGVNRILTEDYHDEGLLFSANRSFNPALPVNRNNRPDVAYFYDVPVSGLDQGDTTYATALNTFGMLTYVWDLSGEEHTSYDARGRVANTVKRIPDPVFYPTLQGSNAPADPQLVSYKTAFDYDSLDRVKRLVYPDNDEVTYEYNERSLLKRIPGGPNGSIISNLVYQPSAQQARIDYGNGIRTTYDYDNRLRLSKLFTFRTQASTNDPQLIHFTYDFDGVSNIRQITDNRPGSAVPAGDKRRNTQIFQYDDLYRLTRAQYSFNLPGQTVRNDGVINYRYDRIGNMMAQTSDIQHHEKGLSVTQLGDMSYGGGAGKAGRIGRTANDPPGPHALTAVSQLSTNNPLPRLYPYDPNGNMLNIDGLACTWDFKDRLVAVDNDEMHAEYSYDFTDRRISKRVKKKPITQASMEP